MMTVPLKLSLVALVMLKHTDAVICWEPVQPEIEVGILGGVKVTLVTMDTMGLDLTIRTQYNNHLGNTETHTCILTNIHTHTQLFMSHQATIRLCG